MYAHTRNSIIETCAPYSMISRDRFENNIDAIDYAERHRLAGDVVEIGVWKGGSMLSMMMASKNYPHFDRQFHLYDTFQGMTAAGEQDKDLNGADAAQLMESNPFIRCISSLDEVKSTLARHAPTVRAHYHVGDILKNTFVPEKIAVLRLDTDWYESTKHELATFYPNVVKGGVVIIDDYGHWKGCQQAVDEFLKTHTVVGPFKVDYTGIYFLKP